MFTSLFTLVKVAEAACCVRGVCIVHDFQNECLCVYALPLAVLARFHKRAFVFLQCAERSCRAALIAELCRPCFAVADLPGVCVCVRAGCVCAVYGLRVLACVWVYVRICNWLVVCIA